MKKEVEQFLKSYNLKDYNLSLIQETNYNTIYKVSSCKDTYIFRIGSRVSIEDVGFESDLIIYLHSLKFCSPEVILNNEGKYFTNLKGYIGILFSYVEGNHIPVSKGHFPDKDQVFKIGQTLALLHKNTKNFKTNYKKTRTVKTELQRVLLMEDLFRNKYVEGEEFISNIKKALNFINISTLENGIIHNDLRSQNVFFSQTNNKIVGVIDYDWSCPGPLIKDVAHTALEWSFPDGEEKPNMDLFNECINGYNSTAEKNIAVDVELYEWVAIAALADSATYFCDRIKNKSENNSKIKINSYMYKKYLYFKNLQ